MITRQRPISVTADLDSKIFTVKLHPRPQDSSCSSLNARHCKLRSIIVTDKFYERKIYFRKRPSIEECLEHRWLTATDFMIKKRERAVFLADKIKRFSEEYHTGKAAEAKKRESVTNTLLSGPSPRQLLRTNSIQEELLTTF